MVGKNNIGRRRFLKRAAGVAAGAIAFPYIVPSSALGKAGTVSPSNRVVVGCIGVGSQGRGVMQNFLHQDDGLLCGLILIHVQSPYRLYLW